MNTSNFQFNLMASVACCGLLELNGPATLKPLPGKSHNSFLYIPENRTENLKKFTEELRAYVQNNVIGGRFRGIVQFVMRTTEIPREEEHNYELNDSLLESFKDAGWVVGPSWHTSENGDYRLTQFSLIVKEWKQ